MHEKAKAYLEGKKESEILLGLDRIGRVLEGLGNPQDRIKAVHVAGTNGKGSTCAFIERILMENGKKVGLYTSPHLVELAERVRIGGEEIPGSEFWVLVERVRKASEKAKTELTYFEILTAVAFLCFEKEKVDYAVLEVGMGGRLDATNACRAGVAVITNVEMEHTKHLGDTLEKIAGEKAGIIKDGQAVVTSETKREVLDVIEKKCRETNSKPVLVSAKDVEWFGVGLHGEHQKLNAACAVAVAKELGSGRRAIENGLKEAFIRGRFEVVQKNPVVILDIAHNPAGMRTVAKTLKEAYPGKEMGLVIGVSNDKDAEGIFREIVHLASKVYITKAKYRGLETGKLGKLVGKAVIEENVNEAVERAIAEAEKDSVVLVTGSNFVVGEAMEALGL